MTTLGTARSRWSRVAAVRRHRLVRSKARGQNEISCRWWRIPRSSRSCPLRRRYPQPPSCPAGYLDRAHIRPGDRRATFAGDVRGDQVAGGSCGRLPADLDRVLAGDGGDAGHLRRWPDNDLVMRGGGAVVRRGREDRVAIRSAGLGTLVHLARTLGATADSDTVAGRGRDSWRPIRGARQPPRRSGSSGAVQPTVMTRGAVAVAVTAVTAAGVGWVTGVDRPAPAAGVRGRRGGADPPPPVDVDAAAATTAVEPHERQAAAVARQEPRLRSRRRQQVPRQLQPRCAMCEFVSLAASSPAGSPTDRRRKL